MKPGVRLAQRHSILSSQLLRAAPNLALSQMLIPKTNTTTQVTVHSSLADPNQLLFLLPCNSGVTCAQDTFGNGRRHFWLAQLTGSMLLASSELKPGKQLNILQCTSLFTTKNYPSQNICSVKAEKPITRELQFGLQQHCVRPQEKTTLGLSLCWLSHFFPLDTSQLSLN